VAKPITKAVLEGTRTEMAKRSPVIRQPHTIERLREELASYESFYHVGTHELELGAKVPRRVASRWLSLHRTLLRLEYEQIAANLPKEDAP
jgi:hypothetical protein